MKFADSLYKCKMLKRAAGTPRVMWYRTVVFYISITTVINTIVIHIPVEWQHKNEATPMPFSPALQALNTPLADPALDTSSKDFRMGTLAENPANCKTPQGFRVWALG